MPRRIIERIISVGEAAAIVGVSPDTMRDLVYADQAREAAIRLMPSTRNLGRDWALLQSEVEAFARIERHPGRPRQRVGSRFDEPGKDPI